MSAVDKEKFISFVKGLGAYDVRVADPRTGFEHAIPGRHPLQIYPDCRSVVVFAVPRPVWANNTGISIHTSDADTANPERLPLVNRLLYTPGRKTVSLSSLLLERVWFAGSDLLRREGFDVVNGYVQEKLCAFEAGIGVYGRSGVILHPELGNRFVPGVFLTNAIFPADGRIQGFEPCENCYACAVACPAQAYETGAMYPANWSFETCFARRTSLASDGLYCHECFRVCSAGSIKDEDLIVMKKIRSIAD
jgi:epoxyqueuosine reductase